jgi:hypothetical protein
MSPAAFEAGCTASGQNDTGAKRRRVAKAPARRSSSCAQQSQAPRSMPPRATSGGDAPFTRISWLTDSAALCASSDGRAEMETKLVDVPVMLIFLSHNGFEAEASSRFYGER